MARLLIEANSVINARDSFDRTPLYIAVKNSSVDMVNLLIENFASPLNKSASGQSSISISKDKIQEFEDKCNGHRLARRICQKSLIELESTGMQESQQAQELKYQIGKINSEISANRMILNRYKSIETMLCRCIFLSLFLKYRGRHLTLKQRQQMWKNQILVSFTEYNH